MNWWSMPSTGVAPTGTGVAVWRVAAWWYHPSGDPGVTWNATR